MATTTPSDEAATEPIAVRRSFSIRAIAIGIALALALAWLAPWNDWFLRNAYLFNNFLPPIVSALLMLAAVVVNPLLGARRLVRGELAVIASLVLAAGGLSSIGFARYWTISVTAPARMLAREPGRALRVPLDDDARTQLRSQLADAMRGDFTRQDADRDGRLDRDEAWGGAARVAGDDRDGDALLSVEEYIAARLARDPRASATWRWALPADLFLGIAEAGAGDPDDAEFRHVVDGYLDGAQRASSQPRVEHRARVTWRGADQAVHDRELALSGAVRERFARAGAIDLDEPFGDALLRARAGDRVETPMGPVDVLAVEPPPSVPWDAWLRVAMGWAPLVVGLCLASVCGAFLVRRQWIHHERLAYPISNVTYALLDDPAPGRRLPPVLGTRAFRLAFATSFAIVAWRALAMLGWVPITFALEFDLTPLMEHEPWVFGLDHWWLFSPRVYFTFIGLVFLVPTEVGFSLWFFFVAQWFVTMLFRSTGHDLSWHHARQFAFGSWTSIALLILWLGRAYYVRVLRAAVGLSREPAARAAAPWAWGVLVGAAVIAGWMVAHGAPLGAACAVSAGLLGLLLVAARGMAETGVPIIVFPQVLDGYIHATVGFGLPLGAVMPLVLLGMCLSDSREALLPYAHSAAHLADRVDAPPRRLSALMIAVAIAAAAIGCAAMVWFAYTGSGHSHPSTPYATVMDGAAWRAEDAPGRAETVATSRGEDLVAIGLGAAVTGAIGIARMFLAWWPFHPLGLAFAIGYGAQAGWFSFFIAWLAKLLTLRYGGVHLYRRLVPAAIGLAMGEAMALCVYSLAKAIVFETTGTTLPAYHYALPP